MTGYYKWKLFNSDSCSIHTCTHACLHVCVFVCVCLCVQVVMTDVIRHMSIETCSKFCNKPKNYINFQNNPLTVFKFRPKQSLSIRLYWLFKYIWMIIDYINLSSGSIRSNHHYKARERSNRIENFWLLIFINNFTWWPFSSWVYNENLVDVMVRVMIYSSEDVSILCS